MRPTSRASTGLCPRPRRRSASPAPATTLPTPRRPAGFPTPAAASSCRCREGGEPMANDGVLLVNFGALQQASADIQKAVNTLQSQLDQLEKDAGPLVATWEGTAQQAYAE